MPAKNKNAYEQMCEAIIANSPRRAKAMRRILRVVTETGPRPRTVLTGLCDIADPHGSTVDKMIDCDMLVPIGQRRGTVYGTPEQARAAARRKAA